VSTLLIEFLLDWLEHTTNESDIGRQWSAHSARMPGDRSSDDGDP
jgi:hypothetical protein